MLPKKTGRKDYDVLQQPNPNSNIKLVNLPNKVIYFSEDKADNKDQLEEEPQLTNDKVISPEGVTCLTCHKICKNPMGLKIHIQRFHDVKFHTKHKLTECKICLKRHFPGIMCKYPNVPERTLKCELCPRSFATARNLNHHYTVTHGRKASDRKLIAFSRQQHPDVITPKLTNGIDGRDNDVETSTSSHDVSTDMETIKTEIKISVRNLEKPIKKKVQKVSQNTSDWSCELCKRTFLTKENLGTHILIHYYDEM